ncbi:MAG TPA: hypothetical protein VKE70_21035 [Candidatus Solibacter sp.]|nr:hypothetical protein [Candidatus Solibacter sp.]
MIFSTRYKTLLAMLVLTGARHAFAQLHTQATRAERAGASGQHMVHATLPLAVGWFNGQPCLYISTDASDADVAAAFNANYAPALANAPSPVPIYAVTNFTQGNIVPSAPSPAGSGNTSQAYSPLWQVNTVTWNAGSTPQVLRSEQEVLAMQRAGNVTISKTNIIVNCSIVWTQSGGVLPGTIVSMTAGQKAGTTMATATMPVTVGWFNGQHVLYLSPEASDPAAGGPQANFSTLLGRAANTTAAVPIFVVTNFKQGNVIPSAPIPTGPKSTSLGYSPLWQVNTVTWKTGVTPFLLTSSDDVQAALASGKVTVTKTGIVVNCPVVSSPLGGVLPGVTVSANGN